MNDEIGLIGVGFIGKLFVDSLTEAGYRLTVYDVEASQMAYATERGAEAAGSPEEVAESSDALLFALPGSPEVEATMAGADGVLSALSPGDVVIDATTVRVDTAVEYAGRCRDRGVHFVSAPLTRAAPEPGIHMMVGGLGEDYEAAREIVETVSERHVRFEDVERALRFKYALQIRYAARVAVDAEIVAFAEDSGVDPRPLSGFLGMDVDERLFEDDFEQDVEGLGGLAIWNKDLGYALEAARGDDTAMPLTAAVHEVYKAGSRLAGDGEGDATTIKKYWKALNGE
jgi:3-hydroxyisobutyrate dehydrogenase-like beta-hydroxyacid dehydrogenase